MVKLAEEQPVARLKERFELTGRFLRFELSKSGEAKRLLIECDDGQQRVKIAKTLRKALPARRAGNDFRHPKSAARLQRNPPQGQIDQASLNRLCLPDRASEGIHRNLLEEELLETRRERFVGDA